ncbi:MAG: hypothetical protein AMXMBFR13_40870 [Phycisphaerae bacterium]
MKRSVMVFVAGIGAWIIVGCAGLPVLLSGSDGDATGMVRDKAEAVARRIGGDSGYGGTLMTGYFDHVPLQMGFVDETALAQKTGMMTVRFLNDTDLACTFDLGYFASHMGPDELSESVEVPAGEELTFAMPCAEIIGLGDLESPGSTGCVLSDGQTVANTMAVPAFLGLDYACGGTHDFHLMHDVDDLDGDGDTEELLLVSEALEAHMGFGGPMGHSHRTGGMFGGHGHFGLSDQLDVLPDDATNGESIYLTGFNLDGERIEFEDGPFWLTAHGGGCASCHSVDGRGGLWVMMTDEIAPDIRYTTLTGEHHDGDHDDDHPPYDDVSLGEAIREGINPGGETLDVAMPRWNLSDEDLADLIEYLKTLDGGDDQS